MANPLSGQIDLTSAQEGTALPSNTDVATFADTTPTDAPSAFTATIDWGDGSSSSAGTVTGGSGSFTVEGGHTYADEGSNPASVTITRTSDQATATASGTVAVAEADVFTPHGTSIFPNVNRSFSGPVASFNDNDVANVPGDFTATIDWGDGQTTAGTVSGGGPGVFNVTGSHTYAAGGQFAMKVAVADDAPSTATFTAGSTAIVRSLSAQMLLTSATEGLALFNVTGIASFTDTNTITDAKNDFAATIDWGDGTTSPGTIVGPPVTNFGSFLVESGHTYADEGNDPASVTITYMPDGVTTTASGTVAVAEADSLTPHGMSLTATAHQAFDAVLASFTPSDITRPISDFTASIDWGDGTSMSAAVLPGNNTFVVDGGHTYALPGQYTVKVTLTDDAPGMASATATTTAFVNGAPPFDFRGIGVSNLVFQNEGGNPGAPPGTLLIPFGNNTTLTYQVDLSWHVITSRDLNGDGKADLIWQNNDGTPGVWLMNGITPLAEVGLANPGPFWHLVAAGDTNGDGNADLIWQGTDGTLGVWLMNGATPLAEAGLVNPGSNWKVIGTADFLQNGHDDILLQDKTSGNLMIDLMNGTTIASTVAITVGDPSWHALSTGVFNGQAEIAWQNDSGQVGVWLMNGTAPAAEVGLANPGPGWQLVSIDHFSLNGVGPASGSGQGLLFQNSINGAMSLWNMNGTAVTGMVNVFSPGAGWQSENGHPFTQG
jgi:hypothetical protein